MTSIEYARRSSKKKPPPLKNCPLTPTKIRCTGDLSASFGLDAEQFSTLFDKLPIAVAIHKVKYNSLNEPVGFVTLALNKAFEKLQCEKLGFRKDQILNHSAQDFYPDVVLEETDWMNVIGKVAQSGKPKHFEIKCKQRFFHVTLYSHKKGYCFTSFMDITQPKLNFQNILAERRKIESALNKSLNKYRSLLKNAPVAICEVDYKTSKFISVNDTLSHILGYSEQELLKLNALDLLCPESKQHFFDIVSKDPNDKKAVEAVEYHCQTKDGRDIYCIIKVKVDTVRGKPSKVLVVMHDITLRKKAQQELIFAEKRFRRLYETTQDGIMARDLNGRMIACNSAYAEILGYTRKELKKIPVKQLLLPNWLAQREQITQKVLRTGRSIVFEREYLRKDGSTFPASVRTWRLTDGKGKVVGLWSIVRDISEQKRLQRNLKVHAEKLEKIVADRTKQLKDSERLVAIGQTAGMVGHDLRNPLQTLTGELYLVKSEVDALADNQVKTNLQESIRLINEQVDYMDKIVSDLQAFVQPIQIDKKPVDLKNLAKQVLSSVFIPPNIYVSMDWLDGFPAVKADPQLLKRVLINLVTNAVQAMPDGGVLSLKMSFNGARRVSLKVSDTGVGIPDSIKSQIFTPLFTTKPRGQGFGLAVCKRVMEAHGGTIHFVSKAGKGAKFTIRFPVD